jgi:hypothetical protein
MATYVAQVGLTLKDGRRVESGETFEVARLPKWVADQGAVVRVEEDEGL